MASWTIQFKISGSFSSRPLLDHEFDFGLNQLGTLRALVAPGTTAPSEGDEVRLYWDLGGAQERLWFWGEVGTKKKDDLRGTIEVFAFDDGYAFYQSQLGDARDYGSVTPYAILTSAGSPRGLIYNSQSVAVMTYGTTAPNAITGANQGNALNFRAHTGRNLINIGRLCEQATYGGGPSYGLEWFVDRDGAGAKRLNVVTRRQRAVAYTAESFQIGQSIHRSPRSTDTESVADRVKVIGTGSGRTRVESSWVGAGSREYVHTDKTILDSTVATNLANRIYNALNAGGTPRFSAKTYRHNLTTYVGDDVDIVPKDGGAATTYRCLGIRYSFQERAFTLEIGRVRRFFATVMRRVENELDSVNLHNQVTDAVPQTLQTGVSVATATLGANQVVNAGITSPQVTVAPAADFGKAEGYLLVFYIELASAPAPTVADHVHTLSAHTHEHPHTHTYDKANTPTGTTDAAGGGATAEPHAHNLTYTSTASGAASTATTGVPSVDQTGTAGAGNVSMLGPLQVEAFMIEGANPPLAIASWVLPHLPQAVQMRASAVYPFAVEIAGTTSIDLVGFTVRNDGSKSVTLAATNTKLEVYKKSLHKHNE